MTRILGLHHPAVARDKPLSSRSETDKQVNFRANLALHNRLQTVADSLGLDISNLVRMILHENLHLYERRVDPVRRKGAADA
jgi:hypothetical protein